MNRLLCLLLVFVILSGCTNAGEFEGIGIDTSQTSSITKTYGENVYTQAMYIFSLNEHIEKKDTSLQSLQMYVEGFQLGIRRRGIYESVDQIISAGLSEYYDAKTVSEIQRASSSLSNLSVKASQLITSLDPAAGESHNSLLELNKRLAEVAVIIYPEYEDKEISLYTLITSPRQLTEKYSQDEITIVLNQINNTLDEALDFINKKVQDLS